MKHQDNHPFDIATGLTGEDTTRHGRTSDLYANMVGPFGGIIAATLLRATFDHESRQGTPVALTVNFAAPVSEGGFDIAVKVIRTNRSTQHWCMELSQQGQTAATATAVYAIRRDSWSSTELPPPPAVSDSGAGVRVTAEGLPAWVYRYDIRYVKGGIPPLIEIRDEKAFLGSEGIQWIRDEPGRAMDFFSLTAICDSFFPRIYVRRNQFVPAGTVSFSVYFHAGAEDLSAVGDSAVLGHARANRFYKTYFDQNAEIWSQDGRLLATSSQIVYFKE